MTAIPSTPALSRNGHWWLAAILVVALLLRVHGLGFGLPALYDPDEPLFVLTAIKLVRDHSLNPEWFGHPGTTTLYALALVDVIVFAVGLLTGRYADPAAFGRAVYANSALIFLPDRAFIVVCGLACVFLTYRLGRAVGGPRVGLIAAGLLAIDPLHIKYSQVIRTDVHATVFIQLCLLATVAICRRGRVADYVFAGVWLGLALATKWPAGLVIVAIFGAGAARLLRYPGERRRALGCLALALATGAATLLIASPYLVLDFAKVTSDLHAEARPYHLGATGHGFWRNSGWYFRTCLAPALGPLGLAAAATGIVMAARRSEPFRVAILPFLLLFFVLICSQALIWDRWIVPLLPLFSIAAAVALAALTDAAGRFGRRGLRLAVGVVAGLAVVIPVVATVRAAAAERVNDTRGLATAWMKQHVAPGSTIIIEYVALDMLDRGWRLLYPVGDGGCVDVASNVHAKIRFSTIDAWRGKRPIIDIGTLNPATIPGCVADYAILVDYDRYLQEEDRSHYVEAIDNYRRIIRSGTIVATIRPVPGAVGGYPVEIVRMRVPPR